MTKIILPKAIRNNPEVQKVFGEQNPEPIKEIRLVPPRRKRQCNYGTANCVVCGKEFTKHSYNGKRCPECLAIEEAKTPRTKFICQVCGRHSRDLRILRDGKMACSFCRESEIRQRRYLKDIQRGKGRTRYQHMLEKGSD